MDFSKLLGTDETETGGGRSSSAKSRGLSMDEISFQ